MSGFCSKCERALPVDAMFCPYCGKPVDSSAPGSAGKPSLSGRNSEPDDKEGQSTYDVFLSYSHFDRKTFGMEYIRRIKEEIEKSLVNLVDHTGPPRVFLDAEALQLGDLWHSRIMEGLHKSKVFVCLVSEQYLTSSYCARERLWWAAKQTHEGRFLDRPYPVYFVELKDMDQGDAKELMSVEMDRKPWFKEFKEELQEEFIRERLENIRTAVSNKFRTARKARNYCSILPPLYDNFVGRITELRELYEHCVNGRHPVLQAFGGVGKTELSVAYAYGFADQYPMGRFLFRMEGVKSWDEAFASALQMDGTDAKGLSKKVFEELNIEIKGCDPRKLHQAAAKAFLKRADKEKLLILLDNLDEETTLLKPSIMRDFLCDSPIPGNIHILGTTRGTFHFSERDSFLSYDLKNLKDDEAFEMLCLTGNGLYPFDRNPPDTENKEYRAAHDVIRILGGHAWSMEIISAFMADNYNHDGLTFATELESLRKDNILFISSEVGGYREKEKAATSVKLLQPTLDKLANLELGEEIVELAVFAACFDPDEIPMYLLKEYWERNFPDVKCSKGIPFFYAMNKLAKYHLLRKDNDFCKMHRLVQSVFLMHKAKYLPHIIKTLPECSFIPAKYWIMLLQKNPELIDICPQDGTLNADDWENLLSNPIFAEKCPWHLFSGKNWASLLASYPKYAPHLLSWDLLDSWGWMWLLSNQPRFSNKCIWDKLIGCDWGRLLKNQPKFADKCIWDKLGGWDWAALIASKPKFADKCDWIKLNGMAWSCLLQKSPSFENKCNWRTLDGYDWAELLKEQPKFASKCDWSKLDGGDWAWLLSDCPEYKNKCDWSKLDGEDMSSLLGAQPKFAGKCDWNKLNGRDWARLLREQPMFAGKCDWSKLDGREWVWLLKVQPEFDNQCDWSKLDGQDWAELLGAQPQLSGNCDWSKLRGRQLREDDLRGSNRHDWGILLAKRPEFADKCDWSKLDGYSWAILLSEQPQFVSKCDWSKLNGQDWAELLGKLPQFADKCDWNELNGQDWADLLGEQPQFADKCDWSKLSNRWNRVCLLKAQPQFADIIGWDILEGQDWVELLNERPSFARHCDWDKLDGGNWSWLLAIQPQFADRCDWNKLDGRDFAWLLIRQPQFADKCDWNKLESRNWVLLLEKQPKFACHCKPGKLSKDDRKHLQEYYPHLHWKR